MARILVIDDEHSVYSAIELTLDPPHRVEWAPGLDEARAAIRRARPDLIILDHRLGKTLTIPAFLTELRSGLPGTPIVVLTAVGDPALSEEAARAGADDFIVKPYDAEEFKRRITALLPRHA